jgi:hypothetical protein
MVKHNGGAVERTGGRPRSFDREEALDRVMLGSCRYGHKATSLSDLGAPMGIYLPAQAR